MNQNRSICAVFALVIVFSSGLVSAADKPTYATQGDCGGYPRVALKTPPGFCVGLVVEGLRFPRGLAFAKDGTPLVVEMRGWMPDRGRLLALRRNAQGATTTEVLLSKLDRPHGLERGPDGKIYIGLPKGVKRFDPASKMVEDLVGGTSKLQALPGNGRHPLTELAFAQDSQKLFLGVGSATDHCEQDKNAPPDPAKPCAETVGDDAQATIREYAFDRAGHLMAGKLIARGLRNSLGLAVHPRTGDLWQAENSRDAIASADASLEDETLPHEELNRIIAGSDYGWPYCYDENRASPEYRSHDCSRMRKPIALLPPHAAPLGMGFYEGTQFPDDYRGSLLIGFHGYRKQGHRIVAMHFSVDGTPGEMRDLVWGWDAPLGNPVDVETAPDGSVWISEDRNGTVLRLFYAKP